ncbi:hypothetical protein GBAR_LOCUS2186 [Geodia barretti]|uniref:Uncharacterized protein n=1 Tax=Geodia barretti TaxID=519541 RepID=A0AA35QYW4_GEOBA|nr:hypothetical protein GBAR_LOCUS2186 [Geodia barretti]
MSRAPGNTTSRM